MPAASGAEAEVPVCLSVHRWCRSVVTWVHREGLRRLVHRKTQPLFKTAQVLQGRGTSEHDSMSGAVNTASPAWETQGHVKGRQPWGLVPEPQSMCQT